MKPGLALLSSIAEAVTAVSKLSEIKETRNGIAFAGSLEKRGFFYYMKNEVEKLLLHSNMKKIQSKLNKKKV